MCVGWVVDFATMRRRLVSSLFWLLRDLDIDLVLIFTRLKYIWSPLTCPESTPQFTAFLPSLIHCCTRLSVGMSWDDQDKEPMIDTNNKNHIDAQLITTYHPTWICTFLTRLPLSHSEVRNGLVTWEDTWKWFDWFCSWMLCTWASGWLRVEVSILILTLA